MNDLTDIYFPLDSVKVNGKGSSRLLRWITLRHFKRCCAKDVFKGKLSAAMDRLWVGGKARGERNNEKKSTICDERDLHFEFVALKRTPYHTGGRYQTTLLEARNGNGYEQGKTSKERRARKDWMKKLSSQAEYISARSRG